MARRGDGGRASPKAIARQIRSLIRTAAIMTRQLEARVKADPYDLEERDIKMLTALAAASAKLIELEESPREPSPTNTATDRSGDLSQQILDSLEALVDGRAAGLARDPR